jgi:hypothetical protein
MDKVQIYYTISLVVTLSLRTWQAVYRPDERDLLTFRENYKFFILAILLNIPVVGRIYGWW